MTAAPAAADRFRYERYEIDPAQGRLTCHYSLGDRRFAERITFAGGDWASPAADAAARFVFLLAGVSYYKTAAPPVVDVGGLASSGPEAELLRLFFLHGLGEFAYTNRLDLSSLRIEGTSARGAVASERGAVASERSGTADRPLVPFGGGIDSIVTVEAVKERHPGAALFVVGHAGQPFAAIEAAAAATGLPCLRAERQLDPQVLRSGPLGFLNGHVPVTGIISAIAVLAAVIEGRDAVVMSNERSADVGSEVAPDRMVNHQFSKSLQFECAFREALAASIGPSPQYFSLLRPFSELWVASRFASLRQYHGVFRSCNRAFAIDPDRRESHWCGQCDKCCFIDLALAPFLGAAELRAVFDGREPLDDDSLARRFRSLLGLPGTTKPFECVGEVEECRTAARAAAARPDRRTNRLLSSLVAELPGSDVETELARLLRPRGAHFVPDEYATEHLLV
jgi:hypothetical protein